LSWYEQTKFIKVKDQTQQSLIIFIKEL